MAQTLKRHLERRFPDDAVEVVCAWHKDVFVNTLRAPGPDPAVKIRQIHYVGHGAGGGLYFGYRNAVAVAAREKLAALLAIPPAAWLADGIKRRTALMFDAGLMSGFFSEALAPAKLAEVKPQLAPDALMHVWGCFAGAPSHTFDTGDAYWNLFNAGGSSVDGLARDVAKTLAIETTACWDPHGIHGMDFCQRTAAAELNCSNVRAARLPQWLWPRSRKVRWITYDRSGTGDEATINFLGDRIPADRIRPGRPPEWLTNEIPLAAATAKPPAFPACSAVRVGV